MDHFKPFWTIFRNVKNCSTNSNLSDHLWPSLTVLDYLWQILNIFDHIGPSWNISNKFWLFWTIFANLKFLGPFRQILHHFKTLWTVLDNFAPFCIILKYLVGFLILLDHFGPFQSFLVKFCGILAIYIGILAKYNGIWASKVVCFVKFSGIFFGTYSGILGKFKWTYFWIGLVTTFKTWHDFVMLSIHKKEDNLTFVGYFHIIQLCKQIMNQTK